MIPVAALVASVTSAKLGPVPIWILAVILQKSMKSSSMSGSIFKKESFRHLRFEKQNSLLKLKMGIKEH
jgi:hypothetical protein